MKKLLITGGSHAEIPMIREAQKAGWYVITTGNNADGLGHREADEYIPGDFSDREYVLELAKREGVAAIMSGCNDFAYLSTAYACEKLGLKGHDSYETAKDVHIKNRFREVTRSLGIRTPKVVRVENEDAAVTAAGELGYPLVVKPVDLTGGKGVMICYDEAMMLEAVRDAFDKTRESYIIFEECIIGSNHGASMILKNQKVVCAVFDNEQYYINKYLVSGATMPSDISAETGRQLINDVNKVAERLRLVDGLFHTQFMVEKDGTAVMIDPCRRPPGDLYVLLAKYASGVNYPEEIMKAETGAGIVGDYCVANHYIARECIMTDKEGTVEDVVIDERLASHIVDKMLWAVKGEQVDDIMKYKAGILIMEFESKEELDEAVEHFNEWAVVKVKEHA